LGVTPDDPSWTPRPGIEIHAVIPAEHVMGAARHGPGYILTEVSTTVISRSRLVDRPRLSISTSRTSDGVARASGRASISPASQSSQHFGNPHVVSIPLRQEIQPQHGAAPAAAALDLKLPAAQLANRRGRDGVGPRGQLGHCFIALSRMVRLNLCS
jgi:hypothetical protein